jgi:hypothetical protein
MNFPKIVSATAIDDTTLLIEFSNHDRKRYCIQHLLDKPMFSPLRNGMEQMWSQMTRDSPSGRHRQRSRS